VVAAHFFMYEIRLLPPLFLLFSYYQYVFSTFYGSVVPHIRIIS